VICSNKIEFKLRREPSRQWIYSSYREPRSPR